MPEMKSSKNAKLLREIESRQRQRKIVVYTWQDRFQNIYHDCDALISMIHDLRLDLKATKISNLDLLSKIPKRR